MANDMAEGTSLGVLQRAVGTKAVGSLLGSPED